MQVDLAPMDVRDGFHGHTVVSGKSPHAVEACGREARRSSGWSSETDGIFLSSETFTPIDARQYAFYLLTVKGYRAATVHWKQATHSAFWDWARQAELIHADATEGLSPVDRVRLARRWADGVIAREGPA